MFYKIALIINVLLSVSANYMLKFAMNRIGIVEFNQEIFNKIKIIILNPLIWISVIIYGLSFLTYAIVLSKLELSRSYPLAIMMATVIIFIISVLVFHESVGLVKVIGIVFSVLGILLLFS